MRSPDSGPRGRAEKGLRATAVLLLAALLWGAFAPAPRPRGRAALPVGPGLATALADWAAAPPADTLAVLADTVPDQRLMDQLVALRHAGTAVTWVDGGVPATALVLERVADPEGGVRVLVAAPANARVVVLDALGAVDTLRVSGGGASALLRAVAGEVRASVGAQTAEADAPESLGLRHLAVLGRAGWESKFIIAALEERGWSVDARLGVAPGIDVTQGSPVLLDTARFAAAIVLDSLPERDAAGVAGYVESGGGLILGPRGARTPALAALAPGRMGPEVRASSLSFAAVSPRRALPFFPLTPLRGDAVVLEASEGRVAAAARRVGAGRVVQLGYEETWRWRLGGGEDAPEAHRAWWAAVVASAAYRPSVTGERTSVARSSAAPRAAIFAAFGAPVGAGGAGAPRSPLRLPYQIAVMLLLLVLLAEWGSRRLRGAP